MSSVSPVSILWSYIVDVLETRSKVHLFAVAPVLGNMAFSWQQFLRLTLQALLPALLVNASWLEALCRSLKKLPVTLLPIYPRCTSQVWTRSSMPLGLESNMISQYGFILTHTKRRKCLKCLRNSMWFVYMCVCLICLCVHATPWTSLNSSSIPRFHQHVLECKNWPSKVEIDRQPQPQILRQLLSCLAT